ncbi:MAG: DUF5018 domain-containing protein [Candidatus Staskawiczbacteria bacterium]|jgi:hypothetical protein
MDFSIIFQLRTKKFWWMDVIFYFVVSLLVATALCYGIFLLKNNWLRQDLRTEETSLGQVGTDQQRQYESDVIGYQKKINDFTALFKNHQFASNVFAFMQTQTIPDVWFKQFSLDEKGGTVQLSGEADSMDALSRQVAALEGNKYVTNVGNINSSLGDSAKIEFNVSITLDQSIFSYLSDMTPILEASVPSVQAQVQQAGIVPAVPAASGTPTATATPTPAPTTPANKTPANNKITVSATKSNEKLITAFDISQPVQAQGAVDENKFTIALNVPYGTDVKDLTPSIVISPLATVLPASNAPQNFSNPLTYMVTAQDGSTQKYEVTVNVLPAPVQKPSKSNSGSAIVIVLIIIIIIVVAVAVAALFVWRRFKNHANR